MKLQNSRAVRHLTQPSTLDLIGVRCFNEEGDGGGSASPSGQGSAPAGDPPPPTESRPAEKPEKSDDVTRLEKALDAERTLRKDAEKKSKERDRLAARVDELESAGQSEAEKVAAAARKEAHAEAMKSVNRRLVQSEARALAAEAKFRDPSRVVRLLEGLDDVAVAEDGTVDSAAISKQLDELAKDAAYLLEQEERPQPKPDPSQGPRGSKTTGADAGREMFENRRNRKKTPAA